MIVVGRVRGSLEASAPLIVGATTVYEHSNVVKIEEDIDGNPVDNLYEYDEVTYTKDEYIKLQAERGDELEATVDDLLTNILPELLGGE